MKYMLSVDLSVHSQSLSVMDNKNGLFFVSPTVDYIFPFFGSARGLICFKCFWERWSLCYLCVMEIDGKLLFFSCCL